jgi:hypothetical protein
MILNVVSAPDPAKQIWYNAKLSNNETIGARIPFSFIYPRSERTFSKFPCFYFPNLIIREVTYGIYST